MSYNKLILSCWEVNGSQFPTILDCLFDISFCGEDVSQIRTEKEQFTACNKEIRRRLPTG